MTPQQKKADELVERFRKYAKIGTDSPVTGRTENAIQCAIICVEEMLSESKSLVFNYGLDETFKEVSPTQTSIPYWQSVLNELKSRL